MGPYVHCQDCRFDNAAQHVFGANGLLGDPNNGLLLKFRRRLRLKSGSRRDQLRPIVIEREYQGLWEDSSRFGHRASKTLILNVSVVPRPSGFEGMEC